MRAVPTIGITVTLLAAMAMAAHGAAPAPNEKLMHPAALNQMAPETYRAKFETTRGDFVIEVRDVLDAVEAAEALSG